MKIRARHQYDHDTDSIYALFSDRNEIRTKQKTLGYRAIEFQHCKRTKAGADIEFRRDVPASVPGILKKFLKPWNTVVQKEHWTSLNNNTYEAIVDVHIDNVPVSIHGTMQLKPTKTGCTNNIQFEFTCGIPFIGDKLAEFVASDSKKIIAAEYRYIRSRANEITQ